MYLVLNLVMLVFSSQSQTVLVSTSFTTSLRWVARKASVQCGKVIEQIDLEDRTPPFVQVYLGCTQGAAAIDEETIRIQTEMFQRITTSNVEEATRKLNKFKTLERCHPVVVR